MVDLRIVDAPVLLQESITDDVKIPTGGLGNYALRLGDLVWYVVAKENLASKSYVDTSSKGVQDKLDIHITNKTNPHQVTKEQVGLGNVDNTADIDKPVSNAVKSALLPKADKMDTYTKSETDSKISTLSSTTYAGHKGYLTLADAQATQASLTANTLVEVTNDTTTANNGVYLWNGTTLTKSTYDVLGQAKADATTKANAAEANAKTYADTNKLDLSKIVTEYVDGNKIGEKTPTYTNLGLDSILRIAALTYYDSVVLRVNEGDVLYLLNDKQSYSPPAGACFAFFANDPNTNRTQTRITDNRVSQTDTATSLAYQKVTVPTGANYLMLNTRFTTAGGVRTDYTWTVNSGAFSNNYTAGKEIVSAINGKAVSNEEVAINAAKAFTRTATRVFDASAYTNNYNMTFADAITAVPVELRKQGLTVRYNNADERTFVHENITNWVVQRLWIRQLNPQAEGAVNYFDSRMFYSGLNIGSTTIAQTYENPLSNYLIIPIYRTYTDGVENTLTISVSPMTLTNSSSGFLKANGETISGTHQAYLLTNKAIPADAKYVYVNLERYDTTTSTVQYLGNADIAKKYLRYYPYNDITNIDLNSVQKDGYPTVGYQKTNSLFLDRTPVGDRLVSPYFKSNLTTVNGLHPAQFVKFIEIQKGQYDLINKATGTLRRFYITRIGRKTDGTVAVNIAHEREDGTMDTPFLGVGYVAPSNDGFVNYEWYRSLDKDPIKIRLIIDPTYLPSNGNIDFTYKQGEIHPNIVAAAATLQGQNKGVQFTDFSDVGIAKTFTNMSLPNAQPITLTKSMLNGVVTRTIMGDIAIDHQQTALIASKLSRFSGTASVYVEAKSNYPSNPTPKLLREKSSVDYNADRGYANGILGKTTDYQFIHPDMCYAPNGVAGYKYWMINSNFANGSDPTEDTDLFVGNDGLNWTKVRGNYETDAGGIPFKNPPVYWNTPYKNAFLPCPIVNESFEFAKDTVTETSTIKAYLNHDPAISYHNGYVNIYLIYVVGFVNSYEKDHMYAICVRTNDGVNWEIVREDGTTMPYNDVNARLIFTKTNGVRNHLRYVYRAGGTAGGEGFAPQVVKVSDTEWYYYAASKYNVTPQTGYSMYVKRYKGSSPYTFDFTKPEILSKNNNTGGNLWHFGMRYYNGTFYCMTMGYVFTSSDGVNFTTTNYPFFWRGMSADLYKPTFVVGHDGRVKIAYGIQVSLGVPHPYQVQRPKNLHNDNRISIDAKVVGTLVVDYPSLTDIMNRSNTAVADAYADVIVMSISQSSRNVRVALVPCVRDFAEIASTLDVMFDDEIYTITHLNARNGGKLDFRGIAVTLPNAASS